LQQPYTSPSDDVADEAALLTALDVLLLVVLDALLLVVLETVLLAALDAAEDELAGVHAGLGATMDIELFAVLGSLFSALTNMVIMVVPGLSVSDGPPHEIAFAEAPARSISRSFGP
jgi:hypothetical protein